MAVRESFGPTKVQVFTIYLFAEKIGQSIRRTEGAKRPTIPDAQ